MHVNVKKWGNSASVRIPASVMAAAAITIEQKVDIREEEGRIVIELVVSVAPTVPKKYNLDELLAQMTPDTFHEFIDRGTPVGKEIW